MQNLIEVDARQLACPLPLLKLKQALNQIAVGDKVHLIATDQASLRDFKSFIGMTEHEMETSQEQNEIHFLVVKG